MSGATQRAATLARTSLTTLYAHLREAGCAAPVEARGQLIRPLLALAGADELGVERDESFWAGVAAVQLAHEASLVHDDVVDNASTRRSEPTLAASRGVAAALIEGDHLLTTAYRMAATTGSLPFVTAFAHAVERTVAGEKLQGRSAGMSLDERAYLGVVSMKSGELLGCALATAPLVAGDPRAGDWYVLGRRIGTLYQMLDDLLDYCPAADPGKPVLGDYAQGRWTWPLLELGFVEFGGDAAGVAERFVQPDASGSTPLQRCSARFHREAERVLAAAAACMPGNQVVPAMVGGWIGRVDDVVAASISTSREQRLRASITARLADTHDLQAFFRANSRSFSFAAGLFPAAFRARVRGVYAFCRITDDLADGDDGIGDDDRLARLDLWERLARQAHDGGRTGITLLDDVMQEAAAAGVPFLYIEELVEGMRMDLRGERYATLDELRVYSYRVAGVVGQWLTRMCGVHDEATLERAAQLGHAMQLTNILRDVGEDLQRDRIYLPARTLASFDITEAQLREVLRGGKAPARYAAMLEHLMAVADRDYEGALQAVGALPRAFRSAIVVAAHVYRAIHDSIRANGYDNMQRRATSSPSTKLVLAARALGGFPLQRPRVAPGPVRATAADAMLYGAAAAAAAADSGATDSVNGGSGRRGISAAILAALLVATPALAIAAVATPAPAIAAEEPLVQQPAQAQPASPAAWARELEAAHAKAPHDAGLALDLVRALFFVGVDSAAAVQRARTTLHTLREAAPEFARARHSLLLAYDGALSMLDAKHGSWPHARLRAMRSGLQRLDEAVRLAPADPEVRYLRLINTHYMPGFFGRRDSARADLQALAGMLPDRSVPPALHAVMLRFVREQAG